MRGKDGGTRVTMIEAVHADRDALYRFAFGMLRDGPDAEDALQDTYLRVVGLVERDGTVVDNPRAWAFRILRNLCIDRLRSRKRNVEARRDPHFRTFMQLADASPRDPEESMIASDALARATAAMDRLPPNEAEVLSLVVAEGMSYADAAFVTGVPVGTVRSRLNRARRLLTGMIDGPVQGETS